MINKRAFIENWGAFFILFAVGIAAGFMMITVWSRMDFEVGLIVKILIFTVIPAAGAAIFTKMWFE